MYMEALSSDFVDIQGGTTGEGIHVGVMGGTVLNAFTTFGGLNWHGDASVSIRICRKGGKR